LSGLVQAVPGIAVGDVIRQYSHREELFVWQAFWRDAADGFTVVSKEVFRFDTPIPVMTCIAAPSSETYPLQRRRNALSPFLPYGISLKELWDVTGELCTGKTVLSKGPARLAQQRWGFQGQDAIALPLIEPLATLLLKGFWFSFCFRKSWALPRPLFPGIENGGLPPDEVPMPQEGRFFLDPQKFSILADRVRSWAPAILAHCNDEDESRALRMDILDTISFLERGQRCLETKTSGHVQYPSQTLISAACLGNLLGSNEHVCNVVPLSLQVALPGVDLSNLLRNASFPKASTIGRAGSALDFAFLLECRERWCNVPCLHYAWADSSPQCGREWFMLMHTSVCMDAVVNACNAANMLTRCRPDLSDHFEAEDADVEQQPRLHTVLLDAIHTHKCIPVALGSGKVSVEDKTSCLLHAMSLECSSRVGLRCHLDNVVSWTTDLGVEAQLPQFQAKHLDSILPTYVHQTLESDLADEDQETVGDADAFPIMPKALLTPGGLHITHNARQDLRTKMLWFDKFWDHLKAVAALLVPQHLRERIIARLVRGTASAEHEHLFASLSLPALYEKRWQVVANFLKNLLPHFRLLKRVWNLQDFLIDGKDAEGDVGASFDVALADPMFCSYVFIVDGVQNILLNLERWLENCACHEHLFTTLSSKRQRKKRGQLFGGAVRFVDCPMRGKRAPELAAGKLEDTIAELSTAALNLFSDQMDFRITPADRAVLMQDFDFAKQHLHVVLVAKFGFWRQIPWRLAGLSHHWPSVARRIAQDCLEEFDASMSKPGMTLEHHHPLSVRFLSETGMREDLQRFANGGCMTDQLMFAVDSLRFIPVVERCVEALHRDVKVAAKHIRLGPTKVSLSFRMREILDLSSFEEGFPARLQTCFDLTRQPKKAAAALGLLSHPIFLPLLRDGCTDVCVWLAALVRAVHRCDLETQFSDMHEARSTHFRKRKVLEAEAEKLHDTKLSVPRTYEDIFKRAIVDHFRAMAGSDVFFTLPVLVDDSAGYEVAPFLGPAEKRLCLRGADEEPLEIVEMAEGADHGREELHFRLLHGFPARMKSMLRPVASTPVFAKDAVMIAVHKCVYNAEGVPQIDIATQDVPHILTSLESCPLNVLRTQFTCASTSRDVRYSLPGLPNIRQSDLVECVTHLLNARALPGGEPTAVSTSPTDLIMSLIDRGLVCRSGQSDRILMSECALPQVRVMCPLHEPKQVCSLRNSDISQYDLMELILALEQNGWSWKKMPSKKNAREALCHEPGKELVWYSQSHSVSKAYLQCLLLSDDLFEKGLARIPHWVEKPGEIYPALLKGEGPQPGRAVPMPALEPDIPVEALQDVAVAEPGQAVAHLSLQEGDHAGHDPTDSIDGLLDLLDEDMPRSNQSDDADRSEGYSASPPIDSPVVDAQSLHSPMDDAVDEAAAALDAAPVEDEGSQPRLGKPANFGVFRLTVKQPSEKAGRKFGGVEARCPFHKKNNRTDCKKYLQLRSADPEEFSKCVRALKMWCNSASRYNRQRLHLQHHVSIDAAPAEEVVAAGCIVVGPAGAVQGDDVLDAEAGAVADGGAPAPAVAPKAKGRGRGKAKAVAKRRGRGRGRGRWGLFPKDKFVFFSDFCFQQFM